MSQINHAKDKQEVCDLIGKSDYLSAIEELYLDCKSLRRTGRVLAITGYSVRHRLIQLDVPVQRRGGSFKKPKGSFRFYEELINKCKTCRSLTRIDLPHGEIYCTCNENKFYICEQRVPKETKGKGAYWESFALDVCYTVYENSLYWTSAMEETIPALKTARTLACKAIQEYEKQMKEESK